MVCGLHFSDALMLGVLCCSMEVRIRLLPLCWCLNFCAAFARPFWGIGEVGLVGIGFFTVDGVSYGGCLCWALECKLFPFEENYFEA